MAVPLGLPSSSFRILLPRKIQNPVREMSYAVDTLYLSMKEESENGIAWMVQREEEENRIWRIPNTGSSGRLSPLNNQDCSRQGTHIKFLLVLSPWIMMQHDPLLITSSVKGSGLTALYGWSHCILATILQDREGNWGSKRLSNQLKVTHLTRNRTGAWNLALLTPEIIWKDPDAGKDWRLEENGTTENEMVGWHHRFNGHEFE